MKTIWKFPIDSTDQQRVLMPVGADILCVQVQLGQPCLWALVDPGREQRFRSIRVIRTGHPCDDIAWDDYIGTYQLSSGQLVFHVFVGSEATHA